MKDRRNFLHSTALLCVTAALPKKKCSDLDALVFAYRRAVNGATFLGDQVVYSRDNWDAINEAFTKIIEAVCGRG
jgi:hypothetical protein